MNHKADIEKELREISTLLPAGIRPEERLPDGYMEDLESAILQKTIYQKTKSSAYIWLKWSPAIAASLVLLLSAMLWLRSTANVSHSPEIGSEDIDQIIAYLSEGDVMSYSTMVGSPDLDLMSGEDAFEALDLEEVKMYMADQLDEFDTEFYSDIHWE